MVTSSAGLHAPHAQGKADTLPDSIESLFDGRRRRDGWTPWCRRPSPTTPAIRRCAPLPAHQASAGRDQAAVRGEFSRRFRDLSSLERFSLLQSIYRRIPVPAFYQDFARIIKGGYVRQILTTNIDSLLEQALESQGLARDVDFEVVVLGTPCSRDALSALEEQDASERQLIIKLHGDITQGEFGLAQDEIDHAVRAARRYIKDELDADLVMVGYEAESGPLNEWLARARSGFWWVDEEPSRIPMDPTHVRWVPLGVSDFFATLAPQLFTLRTMNAAARAPTRGQTAPPEATAVPAEISERDSATRDRPPEGGRASPSLATSASTTPVQRQEQAAERLRRIRELEDRLRAHPDVRGDLLELLVRIERAVDDVDDAAPVDAETRATAIAAGCRPEPNRAASPNPHVVSAALGAVLVVADRLGPTVLNPQDIRALAGFGPSTLVV